MKERGKRNTINVKMYDNKWNGIKEGRRKNSVEEKSEKKLPDCEGEL